MPEYDYKCPDCGKVQSREVPFEARRAPWACECGGFAEYQFPLSAAYGISIQEPYYDPSLGMDIHGKREKKEALKALNLVEAGDRVGGARYEEKSSHANLIRPEAPRGISLGEVQRRRDRAAGEKLRKPTFAQDWGGERKVTVRPTKQGVGMVINGKRITGKGLEK